MKSEWVGMVDIFENPTKTYKCPKCGFILKIISNLAYEYIWGTRGKYLCRACVMEHLSQFVPFLIEDKE